MTLATNNSGHILGDSTTVGRNKYTSAPLADCWHCHRPRVSGQHANRGLCARCYRRWQQHGFAGHAPPDPETNRGIYVIGERIGWQQVAVDEYLLADFAALDRPNVPGRTAELCQRFGVSRRTLARWRKRIAQRERREQLLALARSSCGRTRWRNRLRPGATSRLRGGPGVDPVAAMVAAQILDPSARSTARAACFRA